MADLTIKDVLERLGKDILGWVKSNCVTRQTYSHVGMIVQSTTLDTEEKVINVYGGTAWTQIEGKMLLGASESHAVNTTGGAETHKLSTAELPSHITVLVEAEVPTHRDHIAMV